MRDSRRIQREIQEVANQNNPDVTAAVVEGNMMHWKGRIRGPIGTPYEGGMFIIDIMIPPEYPYAAPKMKFDTKIWHPNISSQTGAICLDILKNEWSPALTIRTALLSVQALLSAPEPNDPQDAEVASQYLRDYELFRQTAKYWTETFASERVINVEDKVRNMMEMGFAEDKCREALSKFANDETLATDYLLSNM
eukprot:GILK01002158.1.p1 GENE.GILK01002158.1~~GILK01002158.1.p1  ORF type:complete len:195 (-),score=26.46 GILK01002158.1:132-716(-)